MYHVGTKWNSAGISVVSWNLLVVTLAEFYPLGPRPSNTMFSFHTSGISWCELGSRLF